MNVRQVPQANWVSYLNTMGTGYGMKGLVSLEEEQLLEAAKATTGLKDFGDPGFREPLAILLKSLESEAALTLTGRILAVADCLRILESRLEIIECEKRNPEIATEEIKSPIFVLGMGRTGTTILHELLAQDPNNRAPLMHEMISPSPISTRYKDGVPQQGVADAFVKICDEIDPSYITKHESAGDLPNECSYMMNHEFHGTSFFGFYNVPSHAIWGSQADPGVAYRMHKRVLQLLQWNTEPNRFVLKDPSHLGMLPALLETYPDAKMVHTHRDPTKVVASTVSLMASNRLMRSEQFDATATAEMMNYGQCASLVKAMAERTSGRLPGSQIADVFFADFIANPIAEVERIYEHWGIELTEAARTAMKNYIDAKPKSKHGKHEYAYSEVTNLDKERERFKGYMDHYSISYE